VHPESVGDAYAAVVDKFKGVLVDLNCEILKVEEWGERKLAYQIQKQSRGSYVLYYFKGGPEVVAEMERRMRIDDTVMRFLTVQREEGYATPATATVGTADAVEAADADDADDADESTEE
jgi:small subunit ribosomal protein S6